MLHAGFLIGLLFDPEIEAMYSSEPSVDFHGTTQGYTSENISRTLHCYRGDNLRSNIVIGKSANTTTNSLKMNAVPSLKTLYRHVTKYTSDNEQC
jgi:hypothetical protein